MAVYGIGHLDRQHDGQEEGAGITLPISKQVWQRQRYAARHKGINESAEDAVRWVCQLILRDRLV